MTVDTLELCVTCAGLLAAPSAPDASEEGIEGGYCAACGRPLAERRVVVEASVVDALVEVERLAPARIETRRPLAAIPRLAALAWRQPAVRSIVTTGASAVALSVAWRALGAGLAARRAARAPSVAGDLPDALTALLGDAAPARRLWRRGRRGRAVAEIIYVRRILFLRR